MHKDWIKQDNMEMNSYYCNDRELQGLQQQKCFAAKILTFILPKLHFTYVWNGSDLAISNVVLGLQPRKSTNIKTTSTIINKCI